MNKKIILPLIAILIISTGFSTFNESTSIIIESPLNITYGQSDIYFNFHTNNSEPTNSSWWTLSNSSSFMFIGYNLIEFDMPNLLSGNYTFTTFFNDSQNYIISNVTYFTVDTSLTNDLSIAEIFAPTKVDPNMEYNISVNITNFNSNTDLFNVPIKFYNNESLFNTTFIDIQKNSSINLTSLLSFPFGTNNNFTISAINPGNESDLTNNNNSIIQNISYLFIIETEPIEVNFSTIINVTIGNANNYTNITDLLVELIPGPNMSVVSTKNYINVLNYSINSTLFNVTINEVGNQSFDVRVYFDGETSPFYSEMSGTINVWQDTTAPNESIKIFGFAATEGFNVINWNYVDEASKYYIYKGVNGQTDFDKNKPNMTVSSKYVTYYQDMNVDMNKWYYYRVAAVDDRGNIGQFSDVIKIIPKDFDAQQAEIDALVVKIAEYEDLKVKEQIYLENLAYLNANLSILTQDIDNILIFKDLIPQEDYFNVYMIKSTLTSANQETELYKKELILKQARFEMVELPSYSTGLRTHDYQNTINNLTILTNEKILTLTLDGVNYYKYDIVKTLENNILDDLTNIHLSFNLPENAIMLLDSSKDFDIESLNPGQQLIVEYSYLTQASVNNSNSFVSLIQLARPESLGPITGYTVFNSINMNDTNPVITASVWIGVLLLGLIYFQKTNIKKLFTKKEKELPLPKIGK